MVYYTLHLSLSQSSEIVLKS